MTERRVTPQSTPARHSQPITAERRARAPAAGAVRPRAREAPRARRHQPQSRVKGRRALLRRERRACTRAAAVVASLQRGGHRRLDLRPPSARVLLGGTAQRPDARRAIATRHVREGCERRLARGARRCHTSCRARRRPRRAPPSSLRSARRGSTGSRAATPPALARPAAGCRLSSSLAKLAWRIGRQGPGKKAIFPQWWRKERKKAGAAGAGRRPERDGEGLRRIRRISCSFVQLWRHAWCRV